MNSETTATNHPVRFAILSPLPRRERTLPGYIRSLTNRNVTADRLIRGIGAAVTLQNRADSWAVHLRTGEISMSEWILILTLLHNSPAMTQVGPFESRELCLKAREVWLQSWDSARSKTATCVQTKYARR